MRRLLATALLTGVLGVLGCTSSHTAPTLETHPVFLTSVTGQSCYRPAIQVDILDDSEHIFGRAELYVTVQSSRFPSETWIVLPLNIGDFAGCRSRYVQLPFEVQPGDSVLFNLLDNDRLSKEEETSIVSGCRAVGYCVVIGGEAYCPNSSRLICPVAEAAADLLGEAVVNDIDWHKFENFGTAEYVVPSTLPSSPSQANKLSLKSGSNYVRAELKIYGPPHEVEFELPAT